MRAPLSWLREYVTVGATADEIARRLAISSLEVERVIDVGRSRIHACHNRTVVIDAKLGERENKQLPVVEAHGLRNIHVYEGEEWVHIREAVGGPTRKFLCLNDVYRQGFFIPRRFIGENIVHLPTVKTHVFTTDHGGLEERVPRSAQRSGATGRIRSSTRPSSTC